LFNIPISDKTREECGRINRLTYWVIVMLVAYNRTGKDQRSDLINFIRENNRDEIATALIPTSKTIKNRVNWFFMEYLC